MGNIVKVQFTGVVEFEQLLNEMQEDFGVKDQKKILTNAVRKSMSPVLSKARQLAPIDTGGLRASLRIEARKPSRRDKKSIYVNPNDVVIGTVTTASGKQLAKGLKLYDYEASYKAKKDVYKKQVIESDGRAIANEFGTAHVAAKPYMRPALETTTSSVLTELGDNLRAQLIKYKSRKI
jgi:HK97 gp10 family phage protein